MTHDGNYQARAEGVAGEQLLSFIERIERVTEEVKALNDDKSDIFAEAKAQGFSVPTMKDLIKLRAKDPSERSEAEALLDLYKSAIGLA